MIVLLDNGSKRADATLALRSLAQALAIRLAAPVAAVSLSHADAIDPVLLDHQAADTFDSFCRKQLLDGEMRFDILPLFFGPSRALSSLLAEKIAHWQSQYPDADFRVAKPLVPLPEGEPRLVQLLQQQIAATGATEDALVILTDHGTPSPAVNAVRGWIAGQLETELGAGRLRQAVMERREGAQYDFNGTTLEALLLQLGQRHEQRLIVIAMLFLLPGRHAGEGGDIDQICQTAGRQFPHLTIIRTALVGEHPLLLDILAERYQSL